MRQIALKTIPEYDGKEDLEIYLKANFEKLFLTEKPALFHVVHGIYGEEQKPFETWRLVRLEKSKPEHKSVYEALAKQIANSISTHLYRRTIELLEAKVNSNKVALL